MPRTAILVVLWFMVMLLALAANDRRQARPGPTTTTCYIAGVTFPASVETCDSIHRAIARRIENERRTK